MGSKKKYEMTRYTGNLPGHELNGQSETIGSTK